MIRSRMGFAVFDLADLQERRGDRRADKVPLRVNVLDAGPVAADLATRG